MSVRFSNTLSNRKEEFVALEPPKVRLYTCGPTVWNYAHVGNLRGNLFYDLLKRHLEFSGYEVMHVMNITDIDDRILHEAYHAEQTIQEYTRGYERAFFEDVKTLRFRPATVYPRATEHVGDIVRLIQGLIASGHAYEVDGDVYYRVDSFPTYGRLAHLDRAGLKPGARVATDKYEKESATDFALWKRAAPGDAALGAAWDSPFGTGRPGWHIECSAMSMRYLGETLDVHAGGVDLMFPHHENEIAQSEGFTGKPFSRFWLHNDHLSDATGEKMSKSLGNISTLRDLLAEGFDPLSIRFFLIAGAHYRTRLRLDAEALHAAGEQVRRLQDFNDRVRRTVPSPGADDAAFVEQVEAARRAYREALDDDLNLPQGLGILFDVVRDANAQLDRGAVGPAGIAALKALLNDADAHLDVLTPTDAVLDAEVEEQIAARESARRGRDFATADRIRDELRKRGIQLEDTAQGVRWRRIRA
ncbi:MAG TPA: cysteine--tRNA ligase [Candidatus Dormibacteraeota bacterium]